MKEITLESLTDEQLQEQAQLLIAMLRTRYPRLDLRRGTVLRDLLVDADAAVGAMFAAQAAEQRESSSLLALSERADAGEEVDQDDVNAVLSNFNMKSVSGTKAHGYVRIAVSTSNVHTVLAGVIFHTVDDVSFVVTKDVVASTSPASGQVMQYAGVTGWWFLVPVEAEENGSGGNLEQGTALDPETAIADFVSASAYGTFSGGSDLEALDKTVARIGSSLSVRSLTTRTAVESQLRDRFDGTESPIVAVSLCGYGNAAQLRDKHNLFGTAVGGRVDVYVRNFTALPVVSLTKTGTRTADGVYEIDVGHEEVPGMIAVKSVTDANSSALASYEFQAAFSADPDTWHDFSLADGDCREAANTVWRDLRLTLTQVPDPENGAGSKEFRVSLVALPKAEEIQDYVDDGLVRNVGSDFVVRGPMVVNVSVRAVVRHSYAVPFDTSAAVAAICEHVNTSGFVGRLTRSEIATILTNLGATSVDLHDESGMLHGYVYDAAGDLHTLSGDALDLDVARDPKAMLTKDTAVFVVEPENVQITTIPVG